MITVIDYGAGNLHSVENALRFLGVPHAVTSRVDDVEHATAILLPGVGHFGHMMRSLDTLGLVPVLREAIGRGVPYLGICLGLHALFDGSEEAPTLPGLRIFRGGIRRFPEGRKVPHMGWNQLQVTPGSRLFQGVADDPYVYFAHAYYLPDYASSSSGENSPGQAALSDYGESFVAAVEEGNVYGTQFHPEKSGDIGLQILKNFAAVALPRQRGGGHAG